MNLIVVKTIISRLTIVCMLIYFISPVLAQAFNSILNPIQSTTYNKKDVTADIDTLDKARVKWFGHLDKPSDRADIRNDDEYGSLIFTNRQSSNVLDFIHRIQSTGDSNSEWTNVTLKEGKFSLLGDEFHEFIFEVPDADLGIRKNFFSWSNC